jgi:hypothetical protein
MPVFNNMSGQSPGTTSRRYHHRASQEKVTPQQEEIIKYVSSSKKFTEMKHCIGLDTVFNVFCIPTYSFRVDSSGKGTERVQGQ